jgi:hypothetical protein
MPAEAVAREAVSAAIGGARQILAASLSCAEGGRFRLIAIAFFQAARMIWGNIHDRSSLVLRHWR